MEKETPKDQAVRKFMADNMNKADESTPGVLTIREGAAAKQLDAIKPNKVHISGTIKAPSEFYEKRKSLHDPNKCHILYDKVSATITLVVDEQFENDNYMIKGSLIANPDLEPFKINKNHLFTVKELMQVLKFNRIHFADKDKNAVVVTHLQQFKANIEKEINNADDGRGNQNIGKTQTLKAELTESFILSMPIYKGEPSKTFSVDIGFQVTDASVNIYLESRDLKELQVSAAESVMSTELAKFKDIVCIEK